MYQFTENLEKEPYVEIRDMAATREVDVSPKKSKVSSAHNATLSTPVILEKPTISTD